MSNWLMNRMFQAQSFKEHAWWTFNLGRHLSNTGA